MVNKGDTRRLDYSSFDNRSRGYPFSSNPTKLMTRLPALIPTPDLRWVIYSFPYVDRIWGIRGS